MQLRPAPWLVLATLVTASLAALSACASTQAGKRTSDCRISAQDSVLLRGEPVYRDCAVTKRAERVSAGSRPDFRPTDFRDACYSVEIELVVDTAGRPETRSARVVRTNSHEFADAVFATVSTWRYEPAMLDGKRVRQIVTEKTTAQTSTVMVPAGSGPPTGPSGRLPPPNC